MTWDCVFLTGEDEGLVELRIEDFGRHRLLYSALLGDLVQHYEFKTLGVTSTDGVFSIKLALWPGQSHVSFCDQINDTLRRFRDLFVCSAVAYCVDNDFFWDSNLEVLS